VTDGHDPIDLPDPRLDPVIEVLFEYNRALTDPYALDQASDAERHTFGYWAERMIAAVHESDAAVGWPEKALAEVLFPGDDAAGSTPLPEPEEGYAVVALPGGLTGRVPLSMIANPEVLVAELDVSVAGPILQEGEYGDGVLEGHDEPYDPDGVLEAPLTVPAEGNLPDDIVPAPTPAQAPKRGKR
jgi:hypothetical protein